MQMLKLFSAVVVALAASGFSHAADIELTHELGSDKGAQLAKLVERFNSNTKGPRIVVSDRSWNQGKAPAMMILETDSESKLLQQKGRYKPLHEVMRAANIPLQTMAPPRMMMPTFIDAQGRALALPVGLGTPVMYVHNAALKAAGLNPQSLPATWQDWQETLGKIGQTATYSCLYTTAEPVSVFIENTSAWNNQAYASSGKGAQITANGLAQVKHLALMNSWVGGRYLQFFGPGHEAESAFIDGRCATLTASSALWPTLRRANLNVTVVPLPYHDGAYGAPQNTIADGAGLWVSAGHSTEEYKQIANFVSFWLTPENQVDWQVNAGYLPLNRAGLFAATDVRLLDDKMTAQRIAIDQLTRRPVNAAGTASALAHRHGVRQVFATEMDNVWNGSKPPKQALDDAVARVKRM